MKRLLCLMSNMNAGGAETFLMKIYREIDKTKYQIDFCINILDKNYYEDEILTLGGKIYRIPSRSNNIKKHNEELANIISNNNYKYVLAVSSSSASFIDLKIAKMSGAKICSIRSSNSNLNMNLKNRFLQSLLRKIFIKYADELISPSDLAAVCMFGKNFNQDKRFNYLHNALNYDEYSFNEYKRKKIRNEFLLEEKDLVVGHVGRFYEQKNHKYLIEIFHELVKKNSKFKLLLVGTGELENEIKSMVANLGIVDHVIFSGVRSDVKDILSAMDVFVFPSLYEGMPNTVVEAQAAGLPCLLADTITKQANITGNVYYKSLSDRPVEWANTIIQLLTNNYSRDTQDSFKNKNYDIESCSKLFVKIVFGEKNDEN